MAVLLLNIFGVPLSRPRIEGDIVLPGDSDEKIGVEVSTFTPNAEMLESVEVDRTNIKRIVAALQRPGRYHISANSTIYYSGGQSTAAAESYVDGVRSRAILYDGDRPTSNCIISGDRVYLWQEGSAEYYAGSRGSFTEDDYVYIPTYEKVLELPQKDILSASFSLYNEQYCIYIESQSEPNGIRSLYYISVDTGLLIGAQRFDGDTLIYAMSCDLLDMPNDADELFVLPDGTTPEQ